MEGVNNMERDPKVEIKKMPSKELLQDFIASMHGEVKVFFNTETGEFERTQKIDPNLGQPTTEQGHKWRQL